MRRKKGDILFLQKNLQSSADFDFKFFFEKFYFNAISVM